VLEEDGLMSEELSPPHFETFEGLLSWESYDFTPTDDCQVDEVGNNTGEYVPADVVLRDSGNDIGAEVEEGFFRLILGIEV